MPEVKTANSGLAVDDFKDILATVITEARKPVLTEEEISLREQTRQAREAIERDNHARRERITLQQSRCIHRHSAKENNATYCVLVNDSINQYIFCQLCRIKVKPGVAPEKNPGSFVYDTDLFNRLLQESR